MSSMRLIFQTVLQELKEVCKYYNYWFYQTIDITYAINDFEVNLGNTALLKLVGKDVFTRKSQVHIMFV